MSQRLKKRIIAMGAVIVGMSILCMLKNPQGNPVFAFSFSCGLILILEPIKHALYDLARKANKEHVESKQ